MVGALFVVYLFVVAVKIVAMMAMAAYVIGAFAGIRAAGAYYKHDPLSWGQRFD